MPLRLIEVAHASNTGRVRTHNEDRSLAEPPLLAVADGMGGAKAGEVAAEITIEAITGLDAPPTVEGLRGRLIEANRRIREAAARDPSRAGMGTTVTAALVDGGEATLMHVGDSRAYLVRAGRIRQLTNDHSVVAEMVREGHLSSEEAERHPSRNIITRALGAEPDVQIDEVQVELGPGDVVLLCTDGLSSLVPDAQIERAIVEAPSLAHAADALVAAALEHGGTDNVTVVLGRLDGASRPAGATSELPVVAVDAPGRMRLPAPPEAGAEAMRTPPVLEQTTRVRRRLRRGLGLAAVVLLLVGAFGAWAGSRTYFVDGDPDGTIRVYHGAPFEVGALKLFAQWADTGVPAAPAVAADPSLLGRSARGQGDAVRHTVDLIWRFGLGEVPEITLPPPTPAKPAPAPRR